MIDTFHGSKLEPTVVGSACWAVGRQVLSATFLPQMPQQRKQQVARLEVAVGKIADAA